MPLDLPDGSSCFLDANILVYQLVEIGESSTICRHFLERVKRLDIDAATTTACLADAVHRVMCIEAQERFRLDRGVVSWLQRHLLRVRELHAPLQAAVQIKALRLRLLATDAQSITDAAELSRQHGLLTNDALIVATMRSNQLTNLATNDDDFDAVPDLIIWKPR